MAPAVSILVPIYNVEKYLRQCLESLVTQTFDDLEIICINDGSTDSSLSIIQEFAESDPRIVILDKANSGYGDSMNRGLACSTGEYVGIVESDDYVEPDMFQKLYGAAKANDLDIARCNYFYHYMADGTDEPTDFSFIPHNEVIAPRDCKPVFFQPPSVWANLYRRSYLIDERIDFLPTPGASYQDTSFTYKAYVLTSRFMMLPDHLLHYRIHEGSSVTQNSAKMFCICDEYSEIWRFIGERERHSQDMQLALLLQFNGYLWNYKRLDDSLKKEFMKRWNQETHVLFSEMMGRSDLKGKMKLLILKCLLTHSYNLDHKKLLYRVMSNKVSRRLLVLCGLS